MDCRDARRQLLRGDPGLVEPSLARHLRRCRGCRAYLRKVQRRDRLITAALKVKPIARSKANKIISAVRDTAAG